MTEIGASQKEEDLSRLLYRICGSGSLCPNKGKMNKVKFGKKYR